MQAKVISHSAKILQNAHPKNVNPKEIMFSNGFLPIYSSPKSVVNPTPQQLSQHPFAPLLIFDTFSKCHHSTAAAPNRSKFGNTVNINAHLQEVKAPKEVDKFDYSKVLRVLVRI
jgi:hypothetical protein